MYMIRANRISIYVFILSQRHYLGQNTVFPIIWKQKLFCTIKPLQENSFESIFSIPLHHYLINLHTVFYLCADVEDLCIWSAIRKLKNPLHAQLKGNSKWWFNFYKSTKNEICAQNFSGWKESVTILVLKVDLSEFKNDNSVYGTNRDSNTLCIGVLLTWYLAISIILREWVWVKWSKIASRQY